MAENEILLMTRTYLMSGHGWMVTTSPCLTRKLWRTTRFIRAEPSSRSSSARTMRTVSLRFLPLTSTVSPRNSWSVSMVLLERAMIELSSLTASVTLQKVSSGSRTAGTGYTHTSELGFFFFFRMAVAVSSTCGGSVRAISARCWVMPTSLCSAPDGSLRFVSS
jgi:hypothetical protein